MPKLKKLKKPSVLEHEPDHIMTTLYEKYNGLIWNRAIAHYQMLPVHIQKVVDVEDFVQEGYIFAAKRMVSHFDSSQSKASSYLHNILSNFYKNLLSQYTNKSRGAVTVGIDTEMENTMLGRKYRPESTVDAQKIARRFHEQASVGLVDYLDRHLFNPAPNRNVVLSSPDFKAHRVEFIALAKKLGLTIDHYRTALHIHHALKENPPR
jgi:hypothetical protein